MSSTAAILNLALPSFLVSFLNGVLSAYSDIYVVVLGIYYKLQTFLYLPASGIVQGMRPVIGYNYGAGEMDRVRKIFRLALLMCGGIMAGGTLLCLFFANGLIGMFTTNPETIQAGGLALRIISFGFIVSSISVTASGALEGPRKRGTVTAHFSDALCSYHYAGGLYFKPYPRCCRSMECILDHRTYQRNSFCVDL